MAEESGEEVKLGEPIAEIETDKATMTYEADAAGFLQQVASEGDTLAIGAVIARLLASAGEARPRRLGASGAAEPAPPEPAAAEPAAAVEAEPVTEPEPEPEPESEPEPTPEPEPGPATAPPASGGRIKASPVARRIAAELGVELSTLTGSGPEGRIVKADVLAAGGPGTTATPAPAAPTAGDGAVKGTVTTIEPTRTQQLIARRMASAKATIPEFQVTVEVDAEAALALREQLRGQTGRSRRSTIS